MTIDSEALKIKPWAINGDRIDPDNSTLRPPLVRNNGWGTSFSEAGGDNPRRPVLNQILCELTSLFREQMSKGVLEHDSSIEYKQFAIVQFNGVLYSRNRAGSGAFDLADWTLVPGIRTAPTAPTNLTVAIVGRSSTLNWVAPADDGGSAYDRIQIQRATNSAFTRDLIETNLERDLTVTSHQQSNLTVNLTYYWRVRYRNTESGYSDFSNTVSRAIVAVAPSAPRAVAVSTPLSQTLRTTWTTPSDNGGAQITDYVIQWKSGAQAFSSARQITVSSSARQIDIGGLTNGVAHDVRVGADNSVGITFSASVSATPAAQVPNQITSVALTAGSFTIAAVATVPASNGSAITGYRFRRKRSGVTEPWTTETSTDNQHTFNELLANVRYDIQAQAINVQGESAWSNSFTIQTLVARPSQITNIALTADLTTIAAVAGVPASNGSAITRYEWRIRRSDQSDNWTTRTTTVSSYTFAGLDQYTNYWIQVRAVNNVGEAIWSPNRQRRTLTNRPIARFVFTNLRRTRDSDGEYRWTFDWRWTGDNSGSPVTSVRVEARIIESDPNEIEMYTPFQTDQLSGTNTSRPSDVNSNARGFEGGTSFSLRGRGTNANGAGQYSDWTVFTPPYATS